MMLSGRVRGLWIGAKARFGAKDQVSRLPLVVRPWDVDLYLHLTNSRYPQMMDLGRLDLLIRSGVGMAMNERKDWPVAVDIHTRFLRELPLGCRYVLHTEVVGQDRKAVRIAQRFWVGDVLHADAEVRIVCTHGGRVVEPTVFQPLLERVE